MSRIGRTPCTARCSWLDWHTDKDKDNQDRVTHVEPVKEINITERCIDAERALRTSLLYVTHTHTHTPAFCVYVWWKGFLCCDSGVFNCRQWSLLSSKETPQVLERALLQDRHRGSERRALWIDYWPAESERRQEVSHFNRVTGLKRLRSGRLFIRRLIGFYLSATLDIFRQWRSSWVFRNKIWQRRRVCVLGF